ncbi:hypothetical protein ES708_17113 [subsurface metagenome]
MKRKTVILIALAVLLCIGVVGGSLFMTGNADWLMYCFYHPDKIDSPEAAAVSFAELEIFLDGYSTVGFPASFGCEEYALVLHDAAEAEGIKAAIVAVRDSGGLRPFHAFNAFATTDEGIVYVDSILGWDLGRCAIAELVDGVYVAKIEEGTYKKTNTLGCERDFLIFW